MHEKHLDNARNTIIMNNMKRFTLILAALFIIWMFCMSKRFSDWLMGNKKPAAPKEPEPIRMELGESLEAYLDESAASSR